MPDPIIEPSWHESSDASSYPESHRLYFLELCDCANELREQLSKFRSGQAQFEQGSKGWAAYQLSINKILQRLPKLEQKMIKYAPPCSAELLPSQDLDSHDAGIPQKTL